MANQLSLNSSHTGPWAIGRRSVTLDDARPAAMRVSGVYDNSVDHRDPTGEADSLTVGTLDSDRDPHVSMTVEN